MKKIGRYEVIEKIGEGGMGTVYKVRRPTLNRIEALKVLSDFCAKDSDLVERFMREAQTMASLPDYSHVVQIFDLDQHEGRYFYTMEFIPHSLAQIIGDAEDATEKTRVRKAVQSRLKIDTAVRIAAHILEGLRVIHAAGIIHRDISPHNIMMVKNENGPVAKLTDFGIAKVSGSHLTKTGMNRMGKQFYCAPEQWDSLASADARSDLYAVGVLMYRILCGKLPAGRFKDPKDINPEVDNALNDCILTAMEQEPEDRFADAATMLGKLRETTRGKAAEGNVETPPPAGTAKKSTSPDTTSKNSKQGRSVRPTVKYPLRSSPKDVSDNEFKEVFGLDENHRPRKFIKNEYEDNGDGTVTDHATGLMWQQSGSDNYLVFEKAQNYIGRLNESGFAGFRDWRLPTVDELLSLVEPKKQSNGLVIDSIFDKKQDWCWSADKRGSSSAWFVSFHLGSVDWLYFDNDYYVRAVRERQSKI